MSTKLSNLLTKSQWLKEKLSMELSFVAMLLKNEKPANAKGFKKSGNGCVAPLIFRAAKGDIVAFDSNSTGYPCSAFYFGYEKWIFNGIEHFLSSTPSGFAGERQCELFIDTPDNAKNYVESLVPENIRKEALVFKPVELIENDEEPLTITFFANPDQMSALVYLVQHNHPMDFDRVKTAFASNCGAIVTFPLLYLEKKEMKAVWGLHDISQRLSFPADITSLTVPYEMFNEILNIAESSFLVTHQWDAVYNRIKINSGK